MHDVVEVRAVSPTAEGGDSRVRARSRRRILEAAHRLVERDGLEQLSMRRLAVEADVSVRTIYNLFDGRDGLMTALVQRSFDAMEAAVEELGSTDPIDRVWEAVSASVASNCRYVPRAVVAAVVSDPARYRELAGRWRGRQLTVDAIRDATQVGLLRDDVPVGRLVEHAGTVFLHLLRDWSDGQIEEAGLTAGVLHAFDLCLLAVARPKTRTRLLEHIAMLEPSLRTPWADDDGSSTYD